MSGSPFHYNLSPDRIRFCPLCGASVDRRAVPPEGKVEMVCAGCSFVYYLSQKVVAGTIPVEDGRILLTRRAIHPSLGKWTFPGGYVDWGEDVATAARREMREEVGLDLAPEGLLGVYSYADAPVVIVVYHVTVPRSLEARADASEVSEIGYFARAAIPWNQLAFRSTRDALEDWFRRPDA